MSIVIYPKTKIYIAAPANAATGGPELLHQLAYKLRVELNFSSCMFYFPRGAIDPIHPEYYQYENPYVNEIEDSEENLLIVPEVASGLEVMGPFTKTRKVIWWLSVDNFYSTIILNSKREFFFNLKRAFNKISRKILDREIFDIDIMRLISKKSKSLSLANFPVVQKANYHLVQSYYAKKHLHDNKIPENRIFYLSDYLNEDFLTAKTNLAQKENIIVYNPLKGRVFTKKIMRNLPDLHFFPIINMTRQQVIKTLQKAKVYIDFGNHPGKDRLPREAAILGCCVITGKRGSAAFYEDVPIPEEYKFDDKTEDIPRIARKIRECVDNFEDKYKDFEDYREFIKQEPLKFIDDLKQIFVRA